MNQPSRPTSAADTGWTLEVVRGVHVGRRHPVAVGQTVLGSGTAAGDGATMLCLADQEGASPRRMAPRHVRLIAAADGTMCAADLLTPGGTFLNNRRLLDNAPQSLTVGDVLQIGGVQLRVARAAEAPPRPEPAPASPAPAGFGARFVYQTAASGAVCRTWDDFLTLSAQKWDELAADLASGRLAEFVAAVGRPDLAPAGATTAPTPAEVDERLHHWLGRLPTRTPALPELDVHPTRLAIAVPSGGVTVARKVRVSNVGYGLLRARVRVEGAAGLTVMLDADVLGGEVVVRDSVDIPLLIAVPDPIPLAATAELVVSGAGVEKRVAIRVDQKTATTSAEAVPAEVTAGPAAPPAPVAAFLGLSLPKRIALAAMAGVVGRLLVGVAGGSIGADAMLAAGPDVPGLRGAAVACGLAGAVVVGTVLGRRAGRGDAAAGAVAGAGLGVALAAVLVATCRAIEPALGARAASPGAVGLTWAALGAGLALLTTLIPRPNPAEAPR